MDEIKCYGCHADNNLIEVIKFYNIDNEAVKEHFCIRCLIKKAVE